MKNQCHAIAELQLNVLHKKAASAWDVSELAQARCSKI